MKQFLPLALLFLLLITGCSEDPPAAATPDEAVGAEFAELLENYQEARLQLNPLEATYLGDDRYNDRMPNLLSQDYKAESRGFYQDFLRRLGGINRRALDPTDQVSYDVLEWELNMALQGADFATELLPLDQFSGIHLAFGQLASGEGAQPFRTVEDYDNWLARVDDFATMMDTARVNLERGAAKGYVLPRALALKLLPQLESLAAEPLEDHLFYSPATMIPDTFPTEERERLQGAFRGMVGQRIIPLFTNLTQYVRDEYLPQTRESSGIAEIPRGKAYYDYLIKLYTTTDMSAEEIHELGLSEVARLRSEMEKVKQEVGFEGDLQAFFDYVRTKPELMPFDSPDEVIANFNDIYDRMKPQLEKLFNKVPKTEFEVRRTEAFREASASAEYNPGSQDGSRPGIFYVPIPKVEEYNTFSDEDLFLHEAIPGHHYQISLTQENEALPDFRRNLWYSAYGEGWALYCESLGKELGLYEDPYQYFGMLSAEMHRAIRLVVDTGIHSKGWSREQAIQYSLENEAESEASIIAEIERYMAIPGQALSYKVGQLKILELRARAEAELGNDFDIRAFHDLVLEGGCLPLNVLERKVDEWIEAA
ncbi:uncharacterized protein (DUF885 family) [Lewinella marina]|uniref:DUF885 domain-containing protein n=1 Tax=Neolewinella marina TaxID=438751 RepID=A0A2G0CKP7_9BACT|nr:DUF885 domain-containing protein [Neolewinella marina]NJB84568.1 uncharacterized protein (DUF885 family) [Neolewinella marina]PHL00546.1 DUF885 domain-containing protein [Neolewinella marina]